MLFLSWMMPFPVGTEDRPGLAVQMGRFDFFLGARLLHCCTHVRPAAGTTFLGGPGLARATGTRDSRFALLDGSFATRLHGCRVLLD